jgi:hypothetical protein
MAHTALVAGFVLPHTRIGKDAMKKFFFIIILILTYIILIGLMNDLRLVNLRLGISPELVMAKRCLWRLCFPIVKDETRSLALSAVIPTVKWIFFLSSPLHSKLPSNEQESTGKL